MVSTNYFELLIKHDITLITATLSLPHPSQPEYEIKNFPIITGVSIKCICEPVCKYHSRIYSIRLWNTSLKNESQQFYKAQLENKLKNESQQFYNPSPKKSLKSESQQFHKAQLEKKFKKWKATIPQSPAWT